MIQKRGVASEKYKILVSHSCFSLTFLCGMSRLVSSRLQLSLLPNEGAGTVHPPGSLVAQLCKDRDKLQNKYVVYHSSAPLLLGYVSHYHHGPVVHYLHCRAGSLSGHQLFLHQSHILITFSVQTHMKTVILS